VIQGRAIAANGDASDIATWSGTSYYLLQAGRGPGFLQTGLDLRMAGVRQRRLLWHVTSLLRGQKARGFQYCSAFLDGLEQRAVDECRRSGLREVISHYQLLPARRLLEHSIRTSYYIDTTLHGLFTTHGMFDWLNGRAAEEAIATERAEYASAFHIVTMSQWVRESLVSRYDIPASRIHTVLPGANLPESAVRRKLEERGPSAIPDRFTFRRPLRLGFTGKDWKRKGLPRLVTAVEMLNRAGIPTELVVIGNVPYEYRNHANVHAAGFIDKSRDVHRFIDTIDSCDLGCVPSHEEPMGIAPIEYLRLGVPVVCTAAGGLVDVCQAAGEASILLSKDTTAEELATELGSLARDTARLHRMRAAAWRQKEHYSWNRAVKELQLIWDTNT
jgi:glycosyltransferase involved in cell wall biosynthesis